MFIIGKQNKKFFGGIKEIWYDYLVKEGGLDDAVSETKFDEYYSYKKLVFKEKISFTPVSMLGFVVWFSVLHFFIHSLGHDFFRIGHMAFTTLCASFLIIQTLVIIQTSNFVKQLRNKKLFNLKYDFDNNYFDLYSAISVITVLVLIVSLGIYSLIRIRFFGYLFAAIFSKIGLITLTIFGLIFLIGYAILKSKNIIYVLSSKLNSFVAKFDNKWEIFMNKFDAFLAKYFPQKERQKNTNPATYQDWLKENYNLDTAPKTITASTLPKAQTASGRVVQTFKSKFWNTKAKICKPYEN